MAFVACPAAAADPPAQAPAPGTRRRPMLQAERALRAAARPRRAAALWCRERDAAGRCPRGPPGIREQRRPPLEGAVEIIQEKAVTVQWPHACRRSQALGPRVAAVRRQAHQLQHDFVARREVRAGRKPRAHAAPEGEERTAAPQAGPHSALRPPPGGAPPDPPPCAKLGLPHWQVRAPQPVVRGGRDFDF